MMTANDFIDELIKHEVNFFTGVPCSYLTPLINEAISRQDTDYIAASSEGEALALATGMWLGGKQGVVLCQNSGLGNMVNPLTSLNTPFQIPVLLLITWRGKPGEKDEPQHKLMGAITTQLLDLLQIKWQVLPKHADQMSDCLATAFHVMKQDNAPYALIIENNSFHTTIDKPQTLDHSSSLVTISAESDRLPSRQDVLSTLVENVDTNSIIIATTGKTGRELFTLRDSDNHLYCVGSMGYANAVAHGLALTHKHLRTIVIDGDGAAIMHMGNLATIGAYKAKNLIHIILDNGAYDSTGGQLTVSNNIDFMSMGKSLGYSWAFSCCSIKAFLELLSAAYPEGPILIHVKINSGSMKNLGRPDLPPDKIARRMQNHIMSLTS